MFNTINSIKVGCCNISKTLPLAFDESLSYLEMLCGILNKLNEVIAQTNENTDFIKNWDKSLDDINTRLSNLENEFNTLVDDVNNTIDTKFLQVYNELLTMINNHITEIYQYIDINNNVLKNYIDEGDAQLRELIENIVIGNIKVYNPTNGLTENINKVIIDVYNALRYYGLTAQEFDVAGLTAQEFDDLNLTAFEFDNYGKNYIGISNKYLNLATGKYEYLQSILDTLFGFHQNGVTCNEFEALDLDCDMFEALEVTAYMFDFSGKDVL